MSIDVQTLYFSLYVAFTFAVLLFGALAFRQVLDELDVRRRRVGEDRKAFLDPLPVTIVLAAFLVFLGVAALVMTIQEPTIYLYALPLIIGVQAAQLAFRVWFQRTQVKTLGIVVRSILFEKLSVVRFEDLGDVEFRHGKCWTLVAASTPNERILFRIFRLSAPMLADMIRTSCGCDVRHVDSDGRRFSTSAKTRP